MCYCLFILLPLKKCFYSCLGVQVSGDYLNKSMVKSGQAQTMVKIPGVGLAMAYMLYSIKGFESWWLLPYIKLVCLVSESRFSSLVASAHKDVQQGEDELVNILDTAFQQHSYNAIFHWKYSVKIIYAIID